MPEGRGTALVRDVYAAFAARDAGRLRTILAPDVVWRQAPGFPGGDERRGADAVIAGVMGAFRADWDGWRFEPERFLDAGDTVVVLGVYAARNRATGRAIRAECAHVFTLSGGQVAGFAQYADTWTIRAAMPDAAAADGIKS
jgi:ketosteroid isomerase-like protein